MKIEAEFQSHLNKEESEQAIRLALMGGGFTYGLVVNRVAENIRYEVVQSGKTVGFVEVVRGE